MFELNPNGSVTLLVGECFRHLPHPVSKYTTVLTGEIL